MESEELKELNGFLPPDVHWDVVSNNHGREVSRVKVDGGWLYAVTIFGSSFFTITFVPDVDLARYESHLRDAYTQGYEAGKSDTLQRYRIREGKPCDVPPRDDIQL